MTSTPSSTMALAVDGVTAGYGSLTAIWDVSVQVRPGEVAVVLGPNGAGKSTLLGTIFGAVDCRGGTVSVAGQDVSALPSPKRRACGLAWVPEGRHPFAHLSVRDNLYVSAWLARRHKSFDRASRELRERFPVLGDKYQRPAGTLSGGEQQILALARMLIQEPRLVMLDEPTVGLAPAIIAVLAETISELKRTDVSWLITEQNVEWLVPFADAVHIMSGGQIVQQGGPELIATREQLRSAYLGDLDHVNQEEQS